MKLNRPLVNCLRRRNRKWTRLNRSIWFGDGGWGEGRARGRARDGSPSLNRPLCSHMRTPLHTHHVDRQTDRQIWLKTFPSRELCMRAMNKLVIFPFTCCTVEVIQRTWYLLCITDLHNRQIGQWQHLSVNHTIHSWVISTDFYCTTLMV